MTKKKPTPKKRPAKPRTLRVPKPIIAALAAPSAERPVVSIDRLKGGELTWSIRVPAATVGGARRRAVAEAIALAQSLDAWQRAAAEARAKAAARSTSINDLLDRKAAAMGAPAAGS